MLGSNINIEKNAHDVESQGNNYSHYYEWIGLNLVALRSVTDFTNCISTVQS